MTILAIVIRCPRNTQILSQTNFVGSHAVGLFMIEAHLESGQIKMKYR